MISLRPVRKELQLKSENAKDTKQKETISKNVTNNSTPHKPGQKTHEPIKHESAKNYKKIKKPRRHRTIRHRGSNKASLRRNSSGNNNKKHKRAVVGGLVGVAAVGVGIVAVAEHNKSNNSNNSSDQAVTDNSNDNGATLQFNKSHHKKHAAKKHNGDKNKLNNLLNDTKSHHSGSKEASSKNLNDILDKTFGGGATGSSLKQLLKAAEKSQLQAAALGNDNPLKPDSNIKAQVASSKPIVATNTNENKDAALSQPTIKPIQPSSAAASNRPVTPAVPSSNTATSPNTPVTPNNPGAAHPSTPAQPTTPVVPVHPVNPGSSSVPVHPVNPGSSSVPVHPVNPGSSSTPVQPSTPGSSSTPVQPSTPGSSSTPVQPITPGSSSTPVQPITPGSSSTPVQPSTPGSSSTPVQPITPGSSSTPVQPITPGSSSTPVQPSTPNSSAKPGSSTTPASSGTPAQSDSKIIQTQASAGVSTANNNLVPLAENIQVAYNNGKPQAIGNIGTGFEDNGSYTITGTINQSNGSKLTVKKTVTVSKGASLNDGDKDTKVTGTVEATPLTVQSGQKVTLFDDTKITSNNGEQVTSSDLPGIVLNHPGKYQIKFRVGNTEIIRNVTVNANSNAIKAKSVQKA